MHNNSRSSMMGFAPNELLIGWEPPLAADQHSESKNATAEEYLSNMRCNRLMVIHALNKVAYKTGTPTMVWKAGQLVWLEGKNLPLPYGMAKLAPRQHGPFKISKIISLVAVRLELPAQWSIHPMFHTNLLTPYTETPSHRPNFMRPPPDLIDGEEEYEVEQICSHCKWGRCKTIQYLIKWKGYPESNNTWEDADQIHVPTLIKLYHRNAAQRSIKARQVHLGRHPLPNLGSPKAPTPSLPYSPIIIHDSTAALVWSTAPENDIRLACSPHTLQV
jgi:Chromo (CHRromatin Organisation MOdifier) domain